MRHFSCTAEIKGVTEGGERYIEGYASTGDMDRDYESIVPTAFTDAIQTYLKNPILFFNHNWTEGIGSVESISLDEKGLKVKAKLATGTELAEKVWTLIQQGIYRAFSIGFRVLEFTDKEQDPSTPLRRIISKVDLFEVSVVTVPANAHATFSLSKAFQFGTDIFLESPETEGDKYAKVAKALQVAAEALKSLPFPAQKANQAPLSSEPSELEGGTKGVPSSDWPLAEESLSWSAPKARKMLGEYASSDGSGDKDKMDWAKYAKGFFYFDEESKENFGSYKLPFCYVENGKVTAVPRGIYACAAACRGARGGVDLPADEMTKVKAQIEKYYKKMDKESPFAQRSFEVDCEEFLESEEEKRGRVLSAANESKLRGAVEKIHSGVESINSVLSLLTEPEENSQKPEGQISGESPTEVGGAPESTSGDSISKSLEDTLLTLKMGVDELTKALAGQKEEN